MGKIASAVGQATRTTADAGAGGGWRPTPVPLSMSDHRAVWNRAFTQTSFAPPPPSRWTQPQPVIYDRTATPSATSQSARRGMPSAGYSSERRARQPFQGRSNLAPNERAFTKLLEAMRSNAPGGWTDDRYEQTLRHFVGITYVAIHRISQQLARAEVKVYHEDPDHPDGKRAVTRHDPPTSLEHARKGVTPYDLVRLLKTPNRQDSFGKWMYRVSQQKKLTGTALTWMVPNVHGVPYELYSIPTALAIPQSATNPLYPEGYYRVQPVYPYGPFSTWPSTTTSVGAAIPGQWMLRFQYPHPLLRYEGYSPLTGLRLHIDSLEMIDRARHYMMRRGIHPNAVLNSSGAEGADELDEDDLMRLKSLFEEDHQGVENFGKLFVAYAGYKLEKWGDLPADMGFEMGWDQLTSFILGGGFGITRPAAGMVEDASYAGLFATLKQLHLITLEPECEDISSELTRHVAPFFGDDLLVEITLPRIDDHEIKFSKLGIAIQGQAMTKNELRQELGLPLTRELWGADFAGTPSLSPASMAEEMVVQPEAQEMLMMAAGPDGQPLIQEEGDGTPPGMNGRGPDTGMLGMNALGPEQNTQDFGMRLPKSLHGKRRRFRQLEMAHSNGDH